MTVKKTLQSLLVFLAFSCPVFSLRTINYGNPSGFGGGVSVCLNPDSIHSKMVVSGPTPTGATCSNLYGQGWPSGFGFVASSLGSYHYITEIDYFGTGADFDNVVYKCWIVYTSWDSVAGNNGDYFCSANENGAPDCAYTPSEISEEKTRCASGYNVGCPCSQSGSFMSQGSYCLDGVLISSTAAAASGIIDPCNYNGIADEGETLFNCSADVSGYLSGCGDGVCSSAESVASCPRDCYNGNGSCDGGETAVSAPFDCKEYGNCGDGVCSSAESVASCPGDCNSYNTDSTGSGNNYVGAYSSFFASSAAAAAATSSTPYISGGRVDAYIVNSTLTVRLSDVDISSSAPPASFLITVSTNNSALLNNVALVYDQLQNCQWLLLFNKLLIPQTEITLPLSYNMDLSAVGMGSIHVEFPMSDIILPIIKWICLLAGFWFALRLALE